MGDPRKSRKKFSRPKAKWNKERIDIEKDILKKYGLRRKKELWKTEAIVRDIKRRARSLLAEENDAEEKALIGKVTKFGFNMKENLTIDDLLELGVESVLERRLETIVCKVGLANTHRQARQFIVHGHISVNGRKSTSPCRLVTVEDEEKIVFKENSKLNGSFVKAGKIDSTEDGVKKSVKKEVEVA